MSKFSAILVAVLICSILITLITPTIAFGGGSDNGGRGDDNDLDFQPNPFLSPEERERALKKYQKYEANRLIQDPPPAQIRNGPPSDYKFDYELPLTIGDVIPVNDDLRGTLHELVKTAFFRYYKVNLHSTCPYWAMNRMCTSGGGCNVCECTENEIPKPWRIESTDQVHNIDEKDLRDKLGNNNNNILTNWEENVWSDAEKEQSDNTATYVNLLENVEGNTGYNGEEPRRIWDAIYNENCFARIGHNNVSNMCFQDRLMYRLISGLHSSISAHVFKNWKLNEQGKHISNQFLWNMLFTAQQHNIDPLELIRLSQSNNNTEILQYQKMIQGDKNVLERINNLFFTLELLLESLSTLDSTPILAYNINLTPEQLNNSIVINTGDYSQDQHTVTLLTNLIKKATNRTQLHTTTTRTVESLSDTPSYSMQSTFATLDKERIENMRHLFHNVSVIMNCVGCEKCRIWSKLNILGLSTGLKLAASRSIGNTNNVINGLKRNEIIAFVNTINSFSEAVNYINTLSFIPVGLQGEDNLVDIVEQDESSGEIGQGIQQVGGENRNEKNNHQNNGKINEKKRAEKSTDLSKGQKIFVICIGIIALGVIIWRQMVQPSDTFGQLDRMNPVGGKSDKNGLKKSVRAIPTQQLERLKRDQQEQLNNAAGLLINKLNSGNNNNVIGNGGKVKNKKMD